MDDRTVYRSFSPGEGFVVQEDAPRAENDSVDQEDFPRAKDEDDQKDSSSADDPVDLEDFLMPGFGRRIILSRTDDSPTRSTTESSHKIIRTHGLISGLILLTPDPSQRLWSPPDGYLRLYESFSRTPVCGFPFQSSWLSIVLVEKLQFLN